MAPTPPLRSDRIDLGLAGGKPDQYAAAFGGTNFIEFLANDRVITRCGSPRTHETSSKSSLVICFSGSSRDPAEIIEQQTAHLLGHSGPTIEAIDRLKADAIEMKRALLVGDIKAMARILDDSWAAKKRTAAGVSNEHIDRLCTVAFTHGALAGKISGAGGGGFLMFIVHPEDRLELIRGLNRVGGEAGPVKLTDRGCAI